MNKKTVAVQPGADHRLGAGAARGSTDKGRSSQPNVLTIERDRVTGIDFNRTPYNAVLDQLISALEKRNFSSFSHSAAVALLFNCGKSKCTRFPEGLIPLHSVVTRCLATEKCIEYEQLLKKRLYFLHTELRCLANA